MLSASPSRTVDVAAPSSQAVRLRAAQPEIQKPSDAPAVEPTAATPQPRRRSARRWLLGGAAVALLVGLGSLAGWEYWTVWRFEVSTDDAYVQADIVAIAPQVSGYIAELQVDDNQKVKAGDVLARIDDRPYAAALAQAQSDVAAAKANIADVEAQLAEQQSLIEEANAAIKVDQAAEAFAAEDSARFGTLAAKGYGTVHDAQQASSQQAGLTASIAKDQAAATAAQQQLAILQAKLAEAKALLAHTEAAERTAQLNLGYTTITAPADGVVGERTVRVGQYVVPGTQLLAVVPLGRTYVVGNFKETQLTDVRPGQPAVIAVDTFPGVTVRGVVDSLAPASGQEFALLPPDNATGNFTKIVQRVPVKIRIDPANPLQGLLRPGMSVTPTIDVHPGAAADLPPADASFHKSDRLQTAAVVASVGP
jgi:membrane fusion protein (multidrug efflux system)